MSHYRINRRQFLHSGLVVGAPWLMPPTQDQTGVLVVIQVRGGWDALSMIVPSEDPVYHRFRPQLALCTKDTLPIAATTELRLHPALSALRHQWEQGNWAIVQNIGHPHPNLSHFESEAKWHTADPVGGVVHTGWLGRLVTASPYEAITLDEMPSQAFAGVDTPALRDLNALILPWDSAGKSALRARLLAAGENTSAQLSAMAQAMQRALTASEHMLGMAKSYSPRAQYGHDALAQDLQTVARLIVGGQRRAVFHLNQVGFDTHSQQCEPNRPAVGIFNDQLSSFAHNVAAFLKDLAAHACDQRVVVWTYSEFGRAARENSVLGTEHGHGGVAFVLGQPVRGGLYGQAPDLQAIREPDLRAEVPWAILHDHRSTDFRRVYAAILEDFCKLPSAPILGGSFDALPLF